MEDTTFFCTCTWRRFESTHGSWGHERNSWILHIKILRPGREQHVIPDSLNHSHYLLKVVSYPENRFTYIQTYKHTSIQTNIQTYIHTYSAEQTQCRTAERSTRCACSSHTWVCTAAVCAVSFRVVAGFASPHHMSTASKGIRRQRVARGSQCSQAQSRLAGGIPETVFHGSHHWHRRTRGNSTGSTTHNSKRTDEFR